MEKLDGIWNVEREGGLLPPMTRVRKVIAGGRGRTVVGRVQARFDVIGNELRYRAPFRRGFTRFRISSCLLAATAAVPT